MLINTGSAVSVCISPIGLYDQNMLCFCEFKIPCDYMSLYKLDLHLNFKRYATNCENIVNLLSLVVAL